jgi:hypothetical protein
VIFGRATFLPLEERGPQVTVENVCHLREVAIPLSLTEEYDTIVQGGDVKDKDGRLVDGVFERFPLRTAPLPPSCIMVVALQEHPATRVAPQSAWLVGGVGDHRRRSVHRARSP